MSLATLLLFCALALVAIVTRGPTVLLRSKAAHRLDRVCGGLVIPAAGSPALYRHAG